MTLAPRWRILTALTVARASMGFLFQSVAALAPFVSSELGLDNAQLGWLSGLYLLPGIALALPGGLLGARYGDKRVALIGLSLMAFGGLWLASATDFIQAQAARLVSGAGATMLNVLLTKMVADWFEGRERVLAMSVLINSWPIGIGLALFSLGPLALAISWRPAMVVAAAFALVGFVIVLAFYRAPSNVAPAPSGMGLGTLTPREWRLLSIASIPWLLFNAAYQFVVGFLPSFLIEGGASIAQSGAMTAVNTVLIITSVLAGGVILRHAARPDLICNVSVIAWGATLLLLANGSSPWLWLVAGGVIAGIPASAYVNLPAEFLRPESRGAGMGIFYTVYYVGCALLPSIAGHLSDVAGSTRATLWCAALMLFLCAPVLVLYRQAMRSAPAPA